jgi:hypothetical protein
MYLAHGRRLLALGLVLLLPLVAILSGCDSQLEEEPFSQITPEQFFQTEEQFLSAAAAVYSQLRADAFTYEWNYWNLQTHSGDGIMVPTRGPDWGDGGIWRQLTQHTWSNTNPFVSDAWTNGYTGIARANGVLTSLAASDFDEETASQFSSEVRFLRAFYYYSLMDLYGGVPIVLEEGADTEFVTQPVSPDNPPPQNSRQEVFDYILSELVGTTSGNLSLSDIENPASGTVLANLPSKADVPYGRATKAAGYTLLARMLLNAEIYTGDASASGISPGQAFYAEAARAAEIVINGENGVGTYSLTPDYYDNFRADNFQTGASEIIFPITHTAEDGRGNTFQMRFLHYNTEIAATPWNGYTTIAEFYESFDIDPGPDGEIGTNDDVDNDRRADQFLSGLQFTQPSVNCVGDECFSDPNSEIATPRGSSEQLNLTLEIPGISLGDVSSEVQVIEGSGVRPLKWEIDPNQSAEFSGNDVPIFRLAELYLILAEAENERGNTGAAVSAINEVRERSGVEEYTASDFSSVSVGRQLILQERGYEFLYEAQRRQDLIRYEFAHGESETGAPYTSADDPYAPTFTAPWLFKVDGSQDGQASEGFRALFPIPQTELDLNPNLSQNPGY